MPDGKARFANYRGVVPMLWVLVTLMSFELVAVHLLLSLWSRTAALLASGVSLLTLAGLVSWTLSWKRRPHELRDGLLRLHMGSLRHVDVPLASVATIRPVSGELLQAADTRNLVPIAYPNRIIELRAPLPDRRATRRIAIRVDDPQAFDKALAPWLD